MRYFLFYLLVASSFFWLCPFIEALACMRATGWRSSLDYLRGGIVWWQGHLIRKQMELGTAVGLYSEWNSKEMLAIRSAAWFDNEPNPEKIEDVLEFLEKVSTFEKEGFISLDLIWDTFGWYLWRYYFYCNEVVMKKRSDWTPAGLDPTLYQDLEEIDPKLLRMEIAERNWKKSCSVKLSDEDVVRELHETKAKFIQAERRNQDS